MISYRIYELDFEGRIAAPSCDLLCCDDIEAMKVAQEMMPNDAVIEVWQGTRRVNGLTPIARRDCLLT